MITTEEKKEAARRAFWSNHPLIAAYRSALRIEDVSLKPFIEFVGAMPTDQFAACVARDGGAS